MPQNYELYLSRASMRPTNFHFELILLQSSPHSYHDQQPNRRKVFPFQTKNSNNKTPDIFFYEVKMEYLCKNLRTNTKSYIIKVSPIGGAHVAPLMVFYWVKHQIGWKFFAACFFFFYFCNQIEPKSEEPMKHHYTHLTNHAAMPTMKHPTFNRHPHTSHCHWWANRWPRSGWCISPSGCSYCLPPSSACCWGWKEMPRWHSAGGKSSDHGQFSYPISSCFSYTIS